MSQPEEPTTPRRLNAEDLFAGSKEVLIVHGGEVYTLRITSKGRLLLTK